jgi:hypothetical protein
MGLPMIGGNGKTAATSTTDAQDATMATERTGADVIGAAATSWRINVLALTSTSVKVVANAFFGMNHWSTHLTAWGWSRPLSSFSPTLLS